MNESSVKSQMKGNFVFALACALVIGILIWSAVPDYLEFEGRGPADDYYNLLVQGFRAGQLNVNRNPSPGLTTLPDPYDPQANNPYVWDPGHLAFDMSYYKRKLYLYFGVTPAIVLFWPYFTLTGHYLPHRTASVIFSVVGFAAAAGLIYGIWRRYFPETSSWVAASGVLAVGLTSGLLELLSRCTVYEVAISCGFAFMVMALAAIWRGLHQGERRIKWMALASLAYGLAIGARPSLLFGAIILPITATAMMRREPGGVSLWRGGLFFAAAVVPLMLVGLGLMLYNYLRFASPFEFGWHYQLTSLDNSTARQFSLQYLWFNFRFYFLEPMRWTFRFPFLQAIPMPPFPPGYGGVETQYGGILSDYPVAWLALAVPLAWRRRGAEETAPLRWFAIALFLLVAISAGTACLFLRAASRYVLDFLPVLLVLAAVGIFGLERAVAGTAVRRTIARCLWCSLLAYSLVFNLLATVDAHGATHYFVGNFFLRQGNLDKAIENFSKASTLEPNDAGLRYALANALSEAGHLDDSIVQYQKALEIQPSFPEADNNLAYTLLNAGRLDDAIKYFQKASELQNNYQTFYNLACAFRMKKTGPEMESNLQKALALQPQFLPAQIDLSWTLATWPDANVRDGARALAIAENLDRQHPDDPKILRTLAAAYAETGHFAEAVATAKRALDLAQTQSRPSLVKQLQGEIGLYQSNSPCRSFNN